MQLLLSSLLLAPNVALMVIKFVQRMMQSQRFSLNVSRELLLRLRALRVKGTKLLSRMTRPSQRVTFSINALSQKMLKHYSEPEVDQIRTVSPSILKMSPQRMLVQVPLP